MGTPIHLVAGGTIEPGRFVKLDAAADFQILQAGANERVFGVSVNAAEVAPTPGAATAAATTGKSCRIFSDGEECLLQLGGTVTRGDRIKADAAGRGVTSATTGTTIQEIGAEALQSGVNLEYIKVKIVRYPFRPALV